MIIFLLGCFARAEENSHPTIPVKYALTVFATLVTLGLLALLFPYTGLMNVSSVDGHSRLEEWYLSTMSRRSIQARADGISVPADLADSAMITSGAVAFAQMCRTCHGAPGVERSVTGEGMTPRPPRLADAAKEWTSGEIYWIVENGIKMAGMPAYGPSHSAEELWEIVAFVKALPEMDSLRYAEITRPPEPISPGASAPPGHEGHDHMH